MSTKMVESLKEVFISLSSACNHKWEDGTFLKWVLEGVNVTTCTSSIIEILDRAGGLLETELGASVLIGDCLKAARSGSERDLLKISVLLLYVATVKLHFLPLKRTLITDLKIDEQRIIEAIFSSLLEKTGFHFTSDTLDEVIEDALNNGKMTSMSSSGTSTNTTPLSRFSRNQRFTSSPSYSYSPSTSSSFPLKDFFSSPITTQIAKYQRIADEQTKLLRLTRIELDQEKMESQTLVKEKEQLLKERQKLREVLEATRLKLYTKTLSATSEDENNDEDTRYHELQRRLADRKDSEKYIESLRKELEEALDAKQELERKVECQRSKLEERSLQIVRSESQVVELQAALAAVKDQNQILNDNCGDLGKQVSEFQEILASRRSTMDQTAFIQHTTSTWSMRCSIGGVSVADISMDDPELAPVSPIGENMADTLIIPQLEENLAKTVEELEVAKSKAHLAETELHKVTEEKLDLSNRLEKMTETHLQQNQALESLKDEKNKVDVSLTTIRADFAALKDNFSQKENELELKNKECSLLTDQVVNLKQESSLSLQILQKSKDEDMKNFTLTLNEKERKLSDINRELETTTMELCRSKNENSSLNKTIEDLTKRLRSITDEKQRLDAIHVQDLEQYSVLQNSLLSTEQTLNQVREELNIIVEQNKIQAMEVKKLNQEKQTLIEENDRCANEFKAQVEETSNLKTCLESLKQEKEHLRLVSEREVQDLHNKVQDKTATSDDLSNMVTNLKERLNTANNEKDEIKTYFEKELNKVRGEVKQFNVQKESMEKQLASQNEKLVEMTKQSENLKEELCNFVACNAENESNISELKVSLMEMEKKFRQKSEECDNSEECRSDFAEKLKSSEIKAIQLQKEIDKISASKSQLEDSLNKAKIDLDETKVATSQLKDELSSKSALLEEKEKEVDHLKVLIKELENINTNLQTEMDRITTNLRKDLKDKTKQLTSDLIAKDEKIAETNKQLETYRCQLDECQRDLKARSDELKAEFLRENEALNCKISSRELEMKEMESKFVGSLKNTEDRCKQELKAQSDKIDELTSELSFKQREALELMTRVNDLTEEKARIESDNEKLTKDIEAATNSVANCERQVTEISSAISHLESENGNLKTRLKELKASLSEKDAMIRNLKQQLEEKELETLTQLGKHETQNVSLGQELSRLKDELKKVREMASEEKSSFERKLKEELAAQKNRYEGRVKEIADRVTKQYKDKLEDCIQSWQSDTKKRDTEIEKMKKILETSKIDAETFKNKMKESEDKYTIAKNKMAEMATKMAEMNQLTASETETLVAKYKVTKDVIKTLNSEKEELQHEIKTLKSSAPYMEIESLNRQLVKIKNENRTLSVQYSAAETKIKELQKAASNDLRHHSSYSTLPSRSNKSPPVFKMPSTIKHTPGRTATGRTQSETNIARRPPMGSGVLFSVDDEEGELFSNSYLTDAKEGRCNVADCGRISELSRRNTMQPAHLKSSYPVETQFYDTNTFKDSDLVAGKASDLHSITSGTANLSMDSPAMRTRSRRLTIDDSATLKRATSSLFDGSLNSSTRLEAKRQRREAHQTSYSKPGPPTPARNKSINSNSSLNKSVASTASVPLKTTEEEVEKTPSSKIRTPLVDSTNRSMRSRIVNTPMSLRKVMSGAFKKRKTYDMKKKQDKGVSLAVGSPARTLTPLKKMMKKKL